MDRPAETISAIVLAVTGAITLIQQALTDGLQADDAQTIVGALMVVYSAVAPVVTWYIARKQRAGALASARDGTVKPEAGVR